MMRRCIRLTLQPRAANSTASQSSRAGWLGDSPWRPKSFGVVTRPAPKWCCQIRLAMTRPSKGWDSSVSQRANAARRPGTAGDAVPASASGPGPRAAGKPGSTRGPLRRNSPRTRTWVSGTLPEGPRTLAVGIGSGALRNASPNCSRIRWRSCGLQSRRARLAMRFNVRACSSSGNWAGARLDVEEAPERNLALLAAREEGGDGGSSPAG